MWKFTCFLTITVMPIFLQHQLAASAAAIHLSPTMQKVALFQFKQSLTITTQIFCLYYSLSGEYYRIRSHPKTMNWSMSSDYCTWDGVTCEQKTGDIIASWKEPYFQTTPSSNSLISVFSTSLETTFAIPTSSQKNSVSLQQV
ncbi:hypothetical protein POM88_049846 [Heracleum sosnowskyi]|uniref:Leucine-rich repeat-containing N-terminal plant-type domain-containing protein n=1 Tax=Heracleum sosnowskyi TaxID=360622 RepID=A0AAD8GYZ9_9APIA|nr:hypothetical protein POM88_049846 [Heracleum sosnowskyi]